MHAIDIFEDLVRFKGRRDFTPDKAFFQNCGQVFFFVEDDEGVGNENGVFE